MTYIHTRPHSRKSLDAEEARRLANICERLGSDSDGERAAAGLVATRLLRQRGLRWSDIISPPLTETPLRDLRPWLIKSGKLTLWEAHFVATLADGPLSPRQRDKLAVIVAKVTP